MLDNVAKYLPAISIFFLVLGAIFNIGFFYEIGFQFIGVVDINNLVYPFGFIFGFVSLTSGLILLADVFEGLSSFAQRPDALQKMNSWIQKRFLPGFAIIIIVLQIIARIHPSFFLSWDITIALGWTAWWVLYCVRGYITYRAGAKLSFGQMVGCAVLLIPAVFFAGKAIAYQQIFFGDLYTILTEDPKPIEKAHLVRASSTGFIVSDDKGTIQLIPTQKIKQVIANTRVER